MARVEKHAEEVGFIEHLEELRGRLMRSILSLLLVSGVCIYFADFIINEVLFRPLKLSNPNAKLQNLVPYGQISLYLQAVLFSSFAVSFPIIFHQIWQFILPGLLPKERKAARFVVLFVSICFLSGISFGYFVVLPISLKFFATFGSPLIENNISIDEYMSFFIGTMLTTGLIFELPFVSYILSKIGFLTPAFMRHYRRHAVVAILIISALVTPSTDAVTMLVIAVPMLILYELSIFISLAVQKKREKKEREELFSAS
ncbi:MAG: twin-arginine translocase subunit TatC [Chloroherpetonaceae bacterium]|nr:twin-arginine translocase subunit TatC [Chloroherpetonaceae bacterium]